MSAVDEIEGNGEDAKEMDDLFDRDHETLEAMKKQKELEIQDGEQDISFECVDCEGEFSRQPKVPVDPGRPTQREVSSMRSVTFLSDPGVHIALKARRYRVHMPVRTAVKKVCWRRASRQSLWITVGQRVTMRRTASDWGIRRC